MKLYLDGLAFGVGRAVVSLGTISFGHAFPAAPEARLYSLLISRATAAARRYPAVLDGPQRLSRPSQERPRLPSGGRAQTPGNGRFSTMPPPGVEPGSTA